MTGTQAGDGGELDELLAAAVAAHAAVLAHQESAAVVATARRDAFRKVLTAGGRGSQTELAKRIGISQGRVSTIASTKTAHHRTITEGTPGDEPHHDRPTT